MKRWIKTFFKNANTCDSLNGQYTSWFDVQRGVRQGDQCSPYLYLICSEILSAMIRQNKQIKGINLKQKEILLSQFADDTLLCVWMEVKRHLIKVSSLSKHLVNFQV